MPTDPQDLASNILTVFEACQSQFRLVTRRAEARFLSRDWRGGQQDAYERLTLYKQFVSWCVGDLKRSLGDDAERLEVWARMREAYIAMAWGEPDAELAYSFFNSVARQVLRVVGPGYGVYFNDDDFQSLPPNSTSQELQRYPVDGSLERALGQLLRCLPVARQMKDLAGDAAAVARRLEGELAGRAVTTIEAMAPLFYRNKGAYVAARLTLGEDTVPLLLALVHDADGVRVDAVLTTADEASVVFSFTRSYFHVAIDNPAPLVAFLHTLMPRKPVDELYTSIGYHKHGKTELVRAMLRQLGRDPDACFELAEGDKGLVMAVFALPALNVVFKIIKDRFGAPKQTTRQQVMDKYRLVFERDRVGRLADAQEFEGLEFALSRFTPEVWRELDAECASSIEAVDDRIRLRHLYTERLVTPLNLYLREADPVRARLAVLDYGQCIKDLAAANIFTGDMLLKNFGVTRHGRVIFYDYDELCLLTECTFRVLPPPRTEEDEFRAEPWFSVGERDVFPEEFRSFMALPGALGEAFLEAHRDLLTVEYWQGMQRAAEAGEVVDFFPYRVERRLK
ncbi:MAG TPA: bifunctional isocitrate dehydrogenase kinase/phosphatase [Gemmatimonadales bacterium]|nr:bifunctional isocitrate dehydrogenase kinase/phosphatase [Gemmatimonadales bacterium]